MNKASILTTIATSGALILGLTAGAAGSLLASSQADNASDDPNAPQDPPVTETYATSDYSFAAFETLPPAQLPEEARSSELSQSVDLDSARLLHHDGATKMYTATDYDGLLCLIISIEGDDWVTATTCDTPDSFAKGGIGVRTHGELGSGEAYLLPDAIAANAPLEVGTLTAGTESNNLVLLDPYASQDERDALSLSNDNLVIIPEIEDE